MNNIIKYIKNDYCRNIYILIVFTILCSNLINTEKLYFLELLNIKYTKYVVIALFFIFVSYFVFNNKYKILRELKYYFVSIFLYITTVIYYNVFTIQFVEDTIKLFLLSFLIFLPSFNKKHHNKITKGLYVFLVLTIIYGISLKYILYLYNVPIFSIRTTFISENGFSDFSSYLLLFAFLIATKINAKKLSYIFLILGAITLTRGFFIAIFIYYLIKYLKKYINLNLNFVYILFFLSILLLLLSHLLIGIEPEQHSQSISRFFTYDNNIYLRFKMYLDVLNLVFNDFINIIFGYGSNYPEVKNIGFVIHNGLLHIIMESGLLFTSILMFILYKLLTKNYNNIEYYFSIATFTLFTPNTLSFYYIILIVFVSKIKISKRIHD